MKKQNFIYQGIRALRMPGVKKMIQLMGGDVEIVLYDTDESLTEIYLTEIYSYGLKLQKIFDFYDPKSELSLLNKRRELSVSEDLLYVLKRALEYCSKTKGKYDISIGRQIMQRKEKKEVQEISCSYKDITIEGSRVRLDNKDVLIDLGSIAKGYIADKIMEYIKRIGVESAFIDARGDMRIFGGHTEIVYIQHPRDESKRVYPIEFKEGALATSGDYKQYDSTFEKNHIIGESEFSSVTVFAETLTEADAAATCIFLMKKEDGGIFSKNNGVKVIAIGKDLKPSIFNGFDKILIKEGA